MEAVLLSGIRFITIIELVNDDRNPPIIIKQ